MLKKGDSMVIFTILGIFAIIDTGSCIKQLANRHNLTRGQFIQDIDYFSSPGLVYGSCRDISTQGIKFEAKCTLLMETIKPVDDATHLRTCDYKLKMNVNEDEQLDLKRLVALSDNRAVIVFESFDTYRYFLVDFSKYCNAYRVDLDQDIKAMVFAPESDKFELVTTEGHQHCENDKRCRLFINDHGRIDEVTHGWLHNDHSDLVAIAAARYSEQLVVDKFEGYIRLYEADHLGMSRMLKEYEIERTSEDYDDRRFASITYNLVSLCSKVKKELKCSQFDLYGSEKFETKDLNFYQFLSFNLLKIHNLPNGGLFIVTTSCTPQYADFCAEDLTHFYVTKIDARGNHVGTIKVVRLVRVSPDKMHLYENEEKKICLSHVFNDWRDDDSIVVDVSCFDDEDFNENSKPPHNPY